MDLIRIFQRFPDNEACMSHLERVRWGDTPHCPHCDCLTVVARLTASASAAGTHGCHRSFNVLAGTIFSKTRIPLPKWFLGMAERQEVAVELSSRVTEQKSAWYMAMLHPRGHDGRARPAGRNRRS